MKRRSKVLNNWTKIYGTNKQFDEDLKRLVNKSEWQKKMIKIRKEKE